VSQLKVSGRDCLMLGKSSIASLASIDEMSILASTVRCSREHFRQTASASVSSPDGSLLPWTQPMVKRPRRLGSRGALVGEWPNEVGRVPDCQWPLVSAISR